LGDREAVVRKRGVRLESEIDFNGEIIPFRLENRSGAPQPLTIAEVGTLVIEALVGSIHFPVAAAIRAVVVVAGRTATEISVEIQGQRVEKRIQLRDRTARIFNDYLGSLKEDQSLDPDIKDILRESVMAELRAEFSRLAQRSRY
jgi:hypothetical protein